MTACADKEMTVYYCVICGPCLCEPISDTDSMTLHRDIPHPADMTFDEEDKPQ